MGRERWVAAGRQNPRCFLVANLQHSPTQLVGDKKLKTKKTNFGELEALKRVSTRRVPEGIAGVRWIHGTLPLTTRGSRWYDGVLNGVGNFGLQLGAKILGGA